MSDIGRWEMLVRGPNGVERKVIGGERTMQDAMAIALRAHPDAKIVPGSVEKRKLDDPEPNRPPPPSCDISAKGRQASAMARKARSDATKAQLLDVISSEASRPADLAEAVGIARPTLNKWLREFEARGLVRRGKDANGAVVRRVDAP